MTLPTTAPPVMAVKASGVVPTLLRACSVSSSTEPISRSSGLS